METIDLSKMPLPSPGQGTVVMSEQDINTGDLVFGKTNTREMLSVLADKKINTKNYGDFCSTECFLKHLNREQNDN
jgi:hypothetical protein